MISLMKYASRFPLIFIIAGVMLLSTIIVQANVGLEDFDVDRSSAPFEQTANSTITPTATSSIDDQTEITPIQLTSSTLTLEPFPTVTMVFPNLPVSATPTNAPATTEPAKGVPLSQISSNNPPMPRTGLFIVIIISWLILVVLAIFIARKASQHWLE